MILASVLLLHHIEGVCKPLSWAKQAAVDFLARTAARDRTGAVERAEQVKAERLARAQRAGQKQEPKVTEKPMPAITQGDPSSHEFSAQFRESEEYLWKQS